MKFSGIDEKGKSVSENFRRTKKMEDYAKLQRSPCGDLGVMKKMEEYKEENYTIDRFFGYITLMKKDHTFDGVHSLNETFGLDKDKAEEIKKKISDLVENDFDSIEKYISRQTSGVLIGSVPSRLRKTYKAMWNFARFIDFKMHYEDLPSKQVTSILDSSSEKQGNSTKTSKKRKNTTAASSKKPKKSRTAEQYTPKEGETFRCRVCKGSVRGRGNYYCPNKKCAVSGCELVDSNGKVVKTFV
jgi:hypothetical protein